MKKKVTVNAEGKAIIREEVTPVEQETTHFSCGSYSMDVEYKDKNDAVGTIVNEQKGE